MDHSRSTATATAPPDAEVMLRSFVKGERGAKLVSRFVPPFLID
jgi:hypothetical protein